MSLKPLLDCVPSVVSGDFLLNPLAVSIDVKTKTDNTTKKMIPDAGETSRVDRPEEHMPPFGLRLTHTKFDIQSVILPNNLFCKRSFLLVQDLFKIFFLNAQSS